MKAVGFIIVSTDRGLCGSLNVNLFKAALTAIREWQQKGASVSLCLIGAKATGVLPASGLADPRAGHASR